MSGEGFTVKPDLEVFCYQPDLDRVEGGLEKIADAIQHCDGVGLRDAEVRGDDLLSN